MLNSFLLAVSFYLHKLSQYKLNTLCISSYCSAVWTIPPLFSRKEHKIANTSTLLFVLNCWIPFNMARKHPVRPIPALQWHTIGNLICSVDFFRSTPPGLMVFFNVPTLFKFCSFESKLHRFVNTSLLNSDMEPSRLLVGWLVVVSGSLCRTWLGQKLSPEFLLWLSDCDELQAASPNVNNLLTFSHNVSLLEVCACELILKVNDLLELVEWHWKVSPVAVSLTSVSLASKLNVCVFRLTQSFLRLILLTLLISLSSRLLAAVVGLVSSPEVSSVPLRSVCGGCGTSGVSSDLVTVLRDSEKQNLDHLQPEVSKYYRKPPKTCQRPLQLS